MAKSVKTFKLGAAPRTDRYDMGVLERSYINHPIVTLPKHEYTPKRIDTDLLVAFGGLARHLGEHFTGDTRYPNAKLLPYYSPNACDVARAHTQIDFMLSWGKRNMYSYPYTDQLSAYFSPLQLRFAAIRKRSLISESMDAHGVLGTVATGGDSAIVALYSAGETIDQTHHQQFEFDSDLPDTVIDVVSAIKVATPLRFHRGVKYIPHNQYICNVFYPNDQSNMVIPVIDTI